MSDFTPVYVYVGDPTGPRSATWRFFIGDDGSVYFSPVETAGVLKMSLHRSGACHVAIDKPHYDRLRKAGHGLPSDRRAIRWQRPAIPLDGTCLAATIVFPTVFLSQSGRLSEPGQPQARVKAPPEGMAAEVGVFFFGAEAHHLWEVDKKAVLAWAKLRDAGEGEQRAALIVQLDERPHRMILPLGRPVDGEPMRFVEVGEAHLRKLEPAT